MGITDTPICGSTGLCHQTSEAVDLAASWLAATPQEIRPHPLVPELCVRFGLTVVEAVEAIRAANMLRAGR